MAVDNFRAVLAAEGLLPKDIHADGCLHRCPTAAKPSKENGAYVLHADFPASGWWQNHETGASGTWTEKADLSPQEKRVLADRAKRAKAQRAADEQERRASAARKAGEIWATAGPADPKHPYLAKKGVPALKPLRQGKNGALVLPLTDAAGTLHSLQFIQPDGQKRFLTGGKKGGCFAEIPGPADAPLYICEGYATGASIHQATGAGVILAFDAGNLKAVALAIKKARPGQSLVIAADNDAATPGNPGLTKAKEAAEATGAALVAPLLTEGAGTDFNDLHVSAGIEAVQEQLGRTSPAEPQTNRRFDLDESGVYALETDSEGNTERTWFCSYLHVKACTCDEAGEDWGRLLELKNPNGNLRTLVLPMRELAGEGDNYRALLLSLGLNLAPGKKARDRLQAYLATSRPQALARGVSRVGWHGNAYVLPDAVYGGQAGEQVVLQAPAMENLYRCKGSLSGWQNSIGAWAVNNPRLMFAVSAAFAGPLLHLDGSEGGGFHFWGPSSLGKTTLLRAAGSVAGGGGKTGFLRQWRATDNGLEAIACHHNDNVLCLDEIGQASGKVVAETAYMLANGQGKGRAGRDGLSRKTASWNLVFLSTGEMALGDKIREEGRRVMAGQAVRVVDIEADAGRGFGIFDSLPGGFDGAGLSKAVGRASGEHYGHPLRAFVERLTQDKAKAANKARALTAQIAGNLVAPGVDGQVVRAAHRFALVAAAGEMAAEFGIAPWPKEAPTLAAWVCLQSWLAGRGGTSSAEYVEALRHVRAFFDLHGASRFEDVDKLNSGPVPNRAGYKRLHNSNIEYLVFPDVFKQELCLNLAPRIVAGLLKENGWIIPDANGSAAPSLRVKGENGTRRLYRFCFTGQERASQG